jgi:hypothetical protein
MGNSKTWEFEAVCGSDITGDPINNLPLAAAFVPSFNSCMDLCASLNYAQTNLTSNCLAVSYVASSPAPANCWAHASNALKVAGNVMAAVLIVG